MRLSQEQIKLISDTVRLAAGSDAAVYLFGSRLDDRAKGGDIDLFIETTEPLRLIERAQIKMRLEMLLGLPVDIVCKTRSAAATPFQVIAQGHAVMLVA